MKTELIWKNPEQAKPTRTGIILVITKEKKPALVNVEERWMCFTDGEEETVERKERR